MVPLLGAAGLALDATVRPAAYALAAPLVALFPANVHAARALVTIAGWPAPPLAVRLPMQLFWIGALLWVARHVA